MASKDRLRERKRRLAQGPSPFDPQDAYLLSSLGKVKVAIPLKEARAVISLNPEGEFLKKKVVHQPFFLPSSFFGLVCFESLMVHLIDLSTLLGETPSPSPPFALVWNTSPLLYGIPLYSEGEKIFISPDKLKGTGKTGEPFCRVSWEGQEVFVIDSQRLIDFAEGKGGIED